MQEILKTPAQNCSVHELGTQSVLLLPISRTGQQCCPVHELDNSQIGRNICNRDLCSVYISVYMVIVLVVHTYFKYCAHMFCIEWKTHHCRLDVCNSSLINTLEHNIGMYTFTNFAVYKNMHYYAQTSLIYLVYYTKILEVNLFAFAYRLFHLCV